MFSPDRKEAIEDQIEELREIEIYSLLRERERDILLGVFRINIDERVVSKRRSLFSLQSRHKKSNTNNNNNNHFDIARFEKKKKTKKKKRTTTFLLRFF